MDTWAEGDRILDCQPRIERRIAVLEHHLHLPAELGEIERDRTDLFSVEQDLADVGLDDLHDQPRGGRLAAAGLADDAERLALGHLEIDAVDGAHHRSRPREQAALAAEMLDEAADRKERRCRAATIARVGRKRRDAVATAPLHAVHGHCLTSIAERRPAETKLNAIEVKKIITPGSAATIGWV